MSDKSKVAKLAVISLISLQALCLPGFAAKEETTALPLSLEEIHAKRKEARSQLMVPSLDGIRGIAYRVVGLKTPDSYEKQMLTRLEQLQLPLFKATELKEGDAPVDAIVQVAFYKTGNNTIAEMSVTQWVSLARSPRTRVRAVTYNDKLFLSGHNPGQAVEKLTDQFVVDFLKANQKQTARAATKSRKGSMEASGSAQKNKSAGK